jgi:hypothetical protein
VIGRAWHSGIDHSEVGCRIARAIQRQQALGAGARWGAHSVGSSRRNSEPERGGTNRHAKPVDRIRGRGRAGGNCASISSPRRNFGRFGTPRSEMAAGGV